MITRVLNMQKYYRTVISLFLVFFYNETAGQQDVYLKVQSGSFQVIPILVAPFNEEPQTGISEQVHSVVLNDLHLSGFFQVLNKKNYIAETDSVEQPVENFSLSNISTVLEGWIVEKDIYLSISIKLSEQPGNTIVFEKEFSGLKNSPRALAHKIADEVIYRLIGIPGVAQSKIAFLSKNGDAKEVFTMDYDGYALRQITDMKSISLSPSWSPDGENIAFTNYFSGNPDLYFIELKSGKMNKLSNFQGLNSAPSWSPDGKQIALTLTKDGNPEIYVMHANGSNIRRLTYNQCIDTSPNWSPIGREIVFTSDRSGNPQIYTMDVDGTNVRRLTYEGSYNVSPVWSPRGDRIAFVSRENNGFHIYTIDTNGENSIRLTNGSGINEDPAWSPNGFHIAFSSKREGKNDIYTMRWDGSYIRRLTRDRENFAPSWVLPRISDQ